MTMYILFSRIRKIIIRSRKRRVAGIGLSLLIGIIVVSTFGFWLLESEKKLSLFDAFWLSYVTMTTVGYGDLYPSSAGGRILGVIVTMTGGIGVVAYIATLLATTFIEGETRRVKGLVQLTCENHFLIINCPNVEKVLAVVDEIRLDKENRDVPIVLISHDFPELPEEFFGIDDFYFVSGNPLLRRVLKRANALNASRAIILAKDSRDPTSDGTTTQIALTLETMHRDQGRAIYTVAEAVSRDSINPLKAAGVEDVICLETMIPPILVQAFLDPGVAEVTTELASNRKGSQYYATEISHLAGRKYGEIRKLFQELGDPKIIPIAILGRHEPVINPDGRRDILNGDRLLYIAVERQDLGDKLKVENESLLWTDSRCT
jgi:voltage-gated potassium channel